MTMTLEQFRATKRRSEDLGEEIGFDTGSEHPVTGWIYGGDEASLYIEDTSSWGEDREARKPFYLLLERSEWFSDDIEDLERRLYMWFLTENTEEQERVYEDALNAALAVVQDAIGVKTGDHAAAYFSDAQKVDPFRDMLYRYIASEMHAG